MNLIIILLLIIILIIMIMILNKMTQSKRGEKKTPYCSANE